MDLDELIDRVSPSNLSIPVRSHVNDTLNTFHVSCQDIQDFQDFEETILAFVFRASCSDTLQQLVGSEPLEHWSHRAHSLLDRIYGPGSMWKAFRIARQGLDDGVLGVLRKLAEMIIQDQVRFYVAYQVDCFVDMVGPEGELRAAWEYMDRYSHLLSAELRDADHRYAVVPLKDLIFDHIQHIEGLRNIRG